MSHNSKNKVFYLITLFMVTLFTFYTIELFLLISKKNIEKIKNDKFLSFKNAKKNYKNLVPYVNSEFTLNHSINFPKIFSPSTLSI